MEKSLMVEFQKQLMTVEEIFWEKKLFWWSSNISWGTEHLLSFIIWWALHHRDTFLCEILLSSYTKLKQETGINILRSFYCHMFIIRIIENKENVMI